MGQEIGRTPFNDFDFRQFQRYLSSETALLSEQIETGIFSSRGPFAGCELEAWLVDNTLSPVPANEPFIARFDAGECSAELARFNVEFNTPVLPLGGTVLSDLEHLLDDILRRGRAIAATLGVELLLIGVLPTLREAELTLDNLSRLNRFRALNEQVLAARKGQPIRLAIAGRQQLESRHRDVMLEAATTSFQLHWQLPVAHVARYYNAALFASVLMVAISANSPFLFGRDLWSETRIPLFEQALPLEALPAGNARSLGRVGFGSGWARESISELFEENLRRFPVLLPMLFKAALGEYTHLRLHNGTIWRWNRPLIGFDADGRPHLRIEHRVIPAGPTTVDMVANAAFYYGLVEALASGETMSQRDFVEVSEDFYRAARLGLSAEIRWEGKRCSVTKAILEHGLPMARTGLERLGIDRSDITRFLAIIDSRARSGITGSEWQRGFNRKYPHDFRALTRRYLENQREGRPVHEWSL